MSLEAVQQTLNDRPNEGPCCWSCFRLDKIGVKYENAKFPVFYDRQSQLTYGEPLAKSDEDVRGVMFSLFIGATVVVALRMAYRSITLLTGDFIRAGYELATREQELEDLTNAQAAAEHEVIAPKGLVMAQDASRVVEFAASSFAFKVIKYSLLQLVKNIVKIVAYPFAWIALEVSALYGIVHTWDGRVLVTQMEHAFSRDIVSESDSGPFAELRLRISDYVAICMAPEEIWDERNLYIVLPSYNPDSFLSIRRYLTSYVTGRRDFFDKVGVYEDLIKCLKALKQEFKDHDTTTRNKAKQRKSLGHNIEDIEALRKEEYKQLCTETHNKLMEMRIAVEKMVEERKYIASVNEQGEKLQKMFLAGATRLDT